MVESSKGTHRIQGCGATFVSPTDGSPQIDGGIRQPTVIGPDHVQRDTVLAAVKDGLQTLIEWRRPCDGHPWRRLRAMSLGPGRSGRRNGPQVEQRNWTKGSKNTWATHNVLDKMPHTRVGKVACRS